jgi:hypothetical protein
MPVIEIEQVVSLQHIEPLREEMGAVASGDREVVVPAVEGRVEVYMDRKGSLEVSICIILFKIRIDLDILIIAADLYEPVVDWLVDLGGVQHLNFAHLLFRMACPGWLAGFRNKNYRLGICGSRACRLYQSHVRSRKIRKYR